MRTFFGKYRGKVTSNRDPMNLGRLQVSVPAVFEEGRTSWAVPCVPYAGKDVGFLALPDVGSNVWVEFEAGDPDHPIWSGAFWGVDEMPLEAKQKPGSTTIFKTKLHTLLLDDTGISIQTKPSGSKPLKLTLGNDAIQINGDENTFVKIQGDTITLKNDRTSIAITANDIVLQHNSTKIEMSADGIRLLSNPALLKLSTKSGIELTNLPSSFKLTSVGTELSSVPSVIKASAAGIELNSGTLGSVKVLPASVNVNNGALEVT